VSTLGQLLVPQGSSLLHSSVLGLGQAIMLLRAQAFSRVDAKLDVFVVEDSDNDIPSSWGCCFCVVDKLNNDGILSLDASGCHPSEIGDVDCRGRFGPRLPRAL
jgi:hypothetical protein